MKQSSKRQSERSEIHSETQAHIEIRLQNEVLTWRMDEKRIKPFIKSWEKRYEIKRQARKKPKSSVPDRPNELVKFYRKKKEMSQVELAKALDTVQAYVSQLESGSRGIGGAMARKLAEVFSVNYREFL